MPLTGFSGPIALRELEQRPSQYAYCFTTAFLGGLNNKSETVASLLLFNQSKTPSTVSSAVSCTSWPPNSLSQRLKPGGKLNVRLWLYGRLRSA